MRRRLCALLLVQFACNGDEGSTGFGGGDGSSGGEGTTSGSSGFTPTGGPTPTTGQASTGGVDTGGTATTPDDTSGTSVSGPGDTTGTVATQTNPGTSSGEETTADASSGGEGSTTNVPQPETCDDEQKNQDETDFDCGGAICEPCGFNGNCEVDADCQSSWCDGGKCGDPGCLADSDCDIFDEACVEASCNVETKFCDVQAFADGEPCDDGAVCTYAETCNGGACGGGKPVDCSDLTNVCGIGQCDEQSGDCTINPFPDMDGQPCDDGWICTPDDTCAAGACGVGGPGYLWFEDFSEPDPGWELGNTWQIGPAVESVPGKNGKDPLDDHTVNDDEMLAGTLIGDLVANGSLMKTCITSPPVDASGASELWLSFWRHLHTDYFPFTINTVEVWNGNDWAVVEFGYANPGIDDPQWKQVSFDLSDHVNAALQVRVCTQQGNGAKAAGGWSLDDLTIGPFVCTPDK